MNQKRMTSYVATVLIFTLAACSGADDTAATAESAESTMAATATAPAAGSTIVDPDLASREELLTVPGLDAASVDALIAGRPYANMVEVNAALAGVPEAQRKEAYVRLFKPIDLNTATADEIMLIPGMTAHLTHEFEEYRPYTEMSQFRQEIGKYVDAAEVARLEQYVAIR
jgi:DNA uptake protein ComE-like DNA-binding protein